VKRLVWLLLLAFSAATAQVQPVDVRLVPQEKCGCCEEKGDCGMPDCGLPPVATPQPVLQLAGSVQVLRLAAKQVAPSPRILGEKFYVRYLARARVAPVRIERALAPPAGVPLFKEHCSFLI
jgi:hypothetical protein